MIEKKEQVENIDNETIVSRIYNLGLLAHVSKLKDSPEGVQALLLRLNPQERLLGKHCTQLLTGLGFLFRADQLKEPLTDSQLRAVLTLLFNADLNNTNIATSIYHLGSLAHASKLKGSPEGVQALLPRLNSQERLLGKLCTQLLMGLGFLFGSDKLKEPLTDPQLRPVLLLFFNAENLNNFNISNMIYSLGEIAHVSKLKGSPEGVQALLTKLNSQEGLSGKHCNNLLVGLSFLFSSGKLKEPLTKPQLQSVLTLLFNASDLTNVDIIDSIYCLEKLACLSKLKNDNLDKTISSLLARLKPQSDLSKKFTNRLVEALKSLVSTGQLSHPFEFWNQAMHERLTDKTSPLTELTTTQQKAPKEIQSTEETVKQTVQEKRLSKEPLTLKRKLSNSSSTKVKRRQSEVWEQACNNNVLFNTLANDSLLSLQQILGLEGKDVPEPREPQSAQYSKSQPPLLHLDNEKKREIHKTSPAVKAVIKHFFEETSPEAMRELIANSADYLRFTVLFQGCDLALRGELASLHLINPLLIYLPLADLKLLLENMVSPLLFHHNSGGALCLMKALDERAEQNKEEAEEIKKLQFKFLNAAKLHHKHNTKKLPLFEAKLESLSRNKELFPVSSLNVQQDNAANQSTIATASTPKSLSNKSSTTETSRKNDVDFKKPLTNSANGPIFSKQLTQPEKNNSLKFEKKPPNSAIPSPDKVKSKTSQKRKNGDPSTATVAKKKKQELVDFFEDGFFEEKNLPTNNSVELRSLNDSYGVFNHFFMHKPNKKVNEEKNLLPSTDNNGPRIIPCASVGNSKLNNPSNNIPLHPAANRLNKSSVEEFLSTEGSINSPQASLNSQPQGNNKFNKSLFLSAPSFFPPPLPLEPNTQFNVPSLKTDKRALSLSQNTGASKNLLRSRRLVLWTEATPPPTEKHIQEENEKLF